MLFRSGKKPLRRSELAPEEVCSLLPIFAYFLFRHLLYRCFRHMTSLAFFLFQLKELWQEEDSEINFPADRTESDDEDPDLVPYTPRVDLEDVQAARASKDSDDDDDCCIMEPYWAWPLAYALPVGEPAGAPARAVARQNAPTAAKGKGKKAANKPKKNAAPPAPGQRRVPRAAPVESG